MEQLENIVSKAPLCQELACKFKRGQVIFNKKHGFRGVIVDMGASLQSMYEASEDEEVQTALSQPWYCVLIDRSSQTTFVPERDLEPDFMGEPVVHPLVPQFFDEFQDGNYVRACDA